MRTRETLLVLRHVTDTVLGRKQIPRRKAEIYKLGNKGQMKLFFRIFVLCVNYFRHLRLVHEIKVAGPSRGGGKTSLLKQPA